MVLVNSMLTRKSTLEATGGRAESDESDGSGAARTAVDGRQGLEAALLDERCDVHRTGHRRPRNRSSIFVRVAPKRSRSERHGADETNWPGATLPPERNTP